MQANYDHHLFTREKPLMATSFLKEETAVNNKAIPPRHPFQPYTNVPANNPKYREEDQPYGRPTNKSH